MSVVSATDNSTDTSVSSDIQSTTHEVEQTSNEVKESSQVTQQPSQNTQSDQQVQQDSKEVQQSTQTTEKTSQNTVNSTKEVKSNTEVTKNTTQDIQNSSQKASNTPQKVENNTTSSEKSNSTEVTINDENKTINETDYASNSSKDLKTASSYTADTYTDLYNQVELIKNSYSSSSSYTINLVSGRNYYVLNRINWGISNYVKSLNINGNGAIINAIDNYEFLYINEGYSLTLNNVTITNTKNYNFIHNCGSLTLNNCMFLNNNYTIIYNSGTAVVTNSISQDYNSYYYIFNNRENLTVKNCSFKYTYKGSCIYNSKNTYIYNSTFSYNYASPIYSYTNSYTYINSSTFENNYDTYGGAIYAKGNVTVNNTVFKNNGAQYGGAIYGGNLTIDKSTFISNTATLGYPVLYTNIKAILSNSIICYENYAKSELMGLKDVIFESNNQYIYGSSITYSTSISASNFSTKTNTKTQINATIKGSDGSIPSGSVKITINGNTYTTNINSDGSIRYNYTFTSTGSYSIKIEYAGSSSYKASSKTITATVTKAIVGTYIITYDKSATVGKSTNLYGYIYGNDNSIPSGSVTITVNGKSYTSTIGSDGYVHISYTFGSTGTYTVKISYAGSSSYSSSSSSFTVTVKSATKINTYITTSDKTATVNKSTNLYGYIKANDGTIPKGSVTITVNGKNYTSSIGSDGYVHISYTFGSAKNYTVKISYAGNSTYNSSSSTFTVKVTSNIKNTTITTQNKNATINKSTNLYGYIKANDGTIPKGSVTITVNGKDFTSSIGSDGYVHISYTFGSAKSYTVKISYAGNSTYSSSSSTFTVSVAIPNTSTVYNYTELYNTIQTIKSYTGSGTYTINLISGECYYITNTINWGSTKGVKNIIINGNGAYIDGSNQKQFLNIANGYTITLNNLNIRNCYAINGGAIINNGNLTVNNTHLLSSKAQNGGAIYSSGVLTLNKTNFNNNNATKYGGSLYTCSEASTSINSSAFTGSFAVIGGAIYNNGYLTSINSTNFNYNQASKTGGAIYNKNYIKISKSLFLLNCAESGGALYNTNTGTKMILNKIEFEQNSALYGGAIFNYKNANLNVSESFFRDNQANNGESIRNKAGTVTLTNNTIPYLSTNKDNAIVTTDGKTTHYNTTYNRTDKINVTINAPDLVVTENSESIPINITDSNNNLINETVYIRVQYPNVGVTYDVYNGITTIPLLSYYTEPGVSNVTISISSTNYQAENITVVIIKNQTNCISVSPATGKNGETITFKAFIIDSNGNEVTRGTATFKLNGVTIKENGKQIKVNITNGVAKYTYTIPTNYSAKDYTLTVVANVNGTRMENTSKLTIKKTDQQLTASTSMFVTGNTAQLSGTIVDVNGKLTTRDTKVAIKINGKTVMNTVVTNGKLNVTLDLSKYSSGVYTIDIVLGENGCYNTGHANMTLIKNSKNSIVVIPTNTTVGSTTTLTAYVTDSNGNRQSSGTVTFKIEGNTVGTGTINNGVANITYKTLQYGIGTHTLTATTTVNGKTLTNSTDFNVHIY